MELLREIVDLTHLGDRGVPLEQALLSMLLAFVLGQLAAWVYVLTHGGLSYSRAFVQSIVLLTIIVCMGLMVIGTNIVVAFGLIGALAVIRFRNILKDTRDTAFIFFALVAGIACGTGNYVLACMGTGVFCVVVLYLHWTSFGNRNTGDGFVHFQMRGEDGDIAAVQGVLARHCRASRLVSRRFQESGTGELAYRVTMRDPERADELVEEMRRVEAVSHVTFVLQEDQAEV